MIYRYDKASGQLVEKNEPEAVIQLLPMPLQEPPHGKELEQIMRQIMLAFSYASVASRDAAQAS